MLFDYDRAKNIALNIFSINFPVDEIILKSAYRSLCKKYHPDINKEVDKKIFINIQESYEYLISLKDTYAFTGTEDGNKNTSNFPFHEYGMGLGPLINGVDCKTCRGKGYQSHEIYEFKNTSKCPFGPCLFCVDGYRRAEVKTGRYTYTVCPTCNGTGETRVFNPVLPKGRLR